MLTLEHSRLKLVEITTWALEGFACNASPLTQDSMAFEYYDGPGSPILHIKAPVFHGGLSK